MNYEGESLSICLLWNLITWLTWKTVIQTSIKCNNNNIVNPFDMKSVGPRGSLCGIWILDALNIQNQCKGHDYHFVLSGVLCLTEFVLKGF